MGIRSAASDADHHQPNRNHPREPQARLLHEMGNRYRHLAHQRCRVLYLDPRAHEPSGQRNVSCMPGYYVWSERGPSANHEHSFVHINEYWDRISKVLILIVDAGLNWYFLHVVKKRLLEHYGLMKYKPLINFNAKLMVVSILMDVSWPESHLPGLRQDTDSRDAAGYVDWPHVAAEPGRLYPIPPGRIHGEAQH
jgi:hypothetical protein